MILPARTSSAYPLRSSGLRNLARLLGPLLLFGCASAPLALNPLTAPPTAQPVPATPALLEKGVPVEREIRPGETQEYRIAANAGDYVRVTVDQSAVDVAVRVIGPGGEEIASVDGVAGRKEPELVSWLAVTAGGYELEVAPHGPMESGTYKVDLKELRAGASGDDKRILADAALHEADHLLALEDIESRRKALARYEEAVSLWQAIGDCPGEVETLTVIGRLHRIMGQVETAVSIYGRALQLALSCGDRAGEASVRNNFAIVYAQLGEQQKALDSYTQAILLWESLGNTGETGTSLFNLGTFHLQQGEFDSALKAFDRALEIRRSSGDIKSQPLILAGIARIHLEQGNPEKALELLAEALALSRQAGKRSDEANVLQNMAGCYLRQGDLQKALELYMEALDLHRLVGDRAHEGQVLSNLGAAAIYLGDPDKALEYYTQALRIHQEIKNRTWEAYALWDIGWIYDLRKDYATALEQYAKALEIGEAIESLPLQALALQGMGRARLALGQPREAGELLEKALALYRSTGNALGEINTLLELGRTAQALSDLDRSSALFREALTLSHQRKTLLSEATAQAALARLERDRGNLPAAALAIDEALRIIESVRPKVTGQRLRTSFFASRRDYYDFYVDLQMRLQHSDPAGGHLVAALVASEKARARVLLDLLAEGRIDVRQGIAPELKQRETEIARRISWLQTRLIEGLSGRSLGEPQAAQLEAELNRSQEERERLEWQIRKEHPRYSAVAHPAPLDLERMQGLLDENTALLEYSVGQESSFLFVVTHDNLSGFSLPGAEVLSGLVDNLRQALENPGRRYYSRYVETAYRLYELLIQPATPLLRDKPHLIIAPDGPLLLLSFEALLTSPALPETQRFGELPYLILDRSVTYIPSASVLAELEVPRQTSQAPVSKLFVGFGAPDYGTFEAGEPRLDAVSTATQGSDPKRSLSTGSLPELVPLPESRKEVLGIAGLYGPDEVMVYLGKDASEENVKENPYLKSARSIHFAVHGLLNKSQPELSGLVLSLDQDPREDGLLQVFEIFNLELGADLVVLSSCETGLGKEVSGEGLIGITRALLYAGTASVVVTLWRVGDTSASELMIRFYKHLSEGIAKADALRLSKLEMIREGRFDHPDHWAPFILVGHPGSSSEVTSLASRRQ